MKIIFFTVCLLYFTTTVHGQNAPMAVTTTLDEYNYLTKGLKRTMEEGADAKSGYVLRDVPPVKIGENYEFTFRPFIKNETGKMVAMSVVVKSKGWGNSMNVWYLCVPRGNNVELLKMYWDSYKGWDSALLKVYADLTSWLLAESSGESEEKK